MFASVWLLAASSVMNAPPPEPAVIAPLIAILKDPDIETRAYAATALAALGWQVVDPLLDALTDKDKNCRAGAAYAFSQLGLTAAPAKTALLNALKDEDKDVRRQAAYALSRLLMAERERPGTSPPPPEPVFPSEPRK